jgi:hypothetical protein
MENKYSDHTALKWCTNDVLHQAKYALKDNGLTWDDIDADPNLVLDHAIETVADEIAEIINDRIWELVGEIIAETLANKRGA